MSCPCHAEAGTFESRVLNPNLHLQSRCPLSCPNVVNRIKWIVLAVETEIHPDNGWKFDICRRTISSFGWFWSIPTMNVKLFWKLCCNVLHYARIVPALGGLFRDSWILILFFNQMNLDATNWFVWSGHLFFPWLDAIYVRKQFWLLSCSPCQSQIWSAKHPQTKKPVITPRIAWRVNITTDKHYVKQSIENCSSYAHQFQMHPRLHPTHASTRTDQTATWVGIVKHCRRPSKYFKTRPTWFANRFQIQTTENIKQKHVLWTLSALVLFFLALLAVKLLW